MADRGRSNLISVGLVVGVLALLGAIGNGAVMGHPGPKPVPPSKVAAEVREGIGKLKDAATFWRGSDEEAATPEGTEDEEQQGRFGRLVDSVKDHLGDKGEGEVEGAGEDGATESVDKDPGDAEFEAARRQYETDLKKHESSVQGYMLRSRLVIALGILASVIGGVVFVSAGGHEMGKVIVVLGLGATGVQLVFMHLFVIAVVIAVVIAAVLLWIFLTEGELPVP